MGRITTHVLDTAAGRPAAGLKVILTRLDGAPKQIVETVTNADGRCDKPLLEGAAFAAGQYEITFHVGDYFRRVGAKLPDPPFLEVVRLGIKSPKDAAVLNTLPVVDNQLGVMTPNGEFWHRYNFQCD